MNHLGELELDDQVIWSPASPRQHHPREIFGEGPFRVVAVHIDKHRCCNQPYTIKSYFYYTLVQLGGDLLMHQGQYHAVRFEAELLVKVLVPAIV